MLQKLGDHIKACMARADECGTAASLAPDDEIRAQQQWQHVAKSYEFISSRAVFTGPTKPYLAQRGREAIQGCPRLADAGGA
jgi:hypothetical protein